MKLPYLLAVAAFPVGYLVSVLFDDWLRARDDRRRRRTKPS